MNAAELKIADPKRFDKAYEQWLRYALDYDWGDGVREMFIEACEPKGVHVSNIGWSLPGSACFDGRVDAAVFMELSGLAERYPALYLAVKDDGSWGFVKTTRNDNVSVSYDSYAIQTGPSGIFSGLDQEAWEEMIESQEAEADLEAAMQEYCVDLSNELYTSLCEEEEYLTGEEAYLEYCEANDITFETDEEEEDYETGY